MRIACCALACVLAFSLVESAEARSARLLAMSAMRASPGWSYPVVAIVPRGALVNARYCISNGWCRVRWRGKRGWIEWKSLRTQEIRRKVERR